VVIGFLNLAAWLTLLPRADYHRRGFNYGDRENHSDIYMANHIMNAGGINARREGKSRSLASPNLRHHGAPLTSLARKKKLPR
jgi:hypothetical protein